MATIDELVKDFLAQKTIAVAGVSLTRATAANNIYRTLRRKEYRVFAISPNTETFDGDPCYADIKSLPVVPDGVVIVTRPEVAEEIVRQCIDTGVKRVWMHDMRGTRPKFAKQSGEKMTSVSAEAVQLCRTHGIAVIAGSCPMQFIGDFGHTCMRWTLRLVGALEAPAVQAKAA